ncbi:MAG: hypothetical protein AAB426_07475, partial [Myxococcota bacterium]
MTEDRHNKGGRMVVYALFALTAAYLLVTVIGGIVVNLYGTPPQESASDELSARERTWCTRTLIAL